MLKARINIATLAALTIAACVATPARSQQTAPARKTLEECITIAIESNYGIKIARNESRIAANNVTGSEFMPSVTLRGGVDGDFASSRSHYEDREDEFQRISSGDYNASVDVSWTLFDGMAMFASHDIKKELLKAGELNLRKSMEDLVEDVSLQYYKIISLQSRLQAARDNLHISTTRYQEAETKHSVGSFSGLDLAQARLDFNADSSEVVLQEQVLSNAYVAFYEMLNVPLDCDIRVSENIVPESDLSLEELKSSADIYNTTIQLARNGQSVSELDLKVARSSRYPTIDLTGGYAFRHSNNSSLASRYQQRYGPSVGLSLSMNIFNGLESRRRIRNASLAVDNSALMLKQTELEIESYITQYYNIYRKNMAMIDFESESAAVARENMEAAVLKHRVGDISGTDFREIQRSYINAINREVDARYEAKVSEITLLYYAGLLLER